MPIPAPPPYELAMENLVMARKDHRWGQGIRQDPRPSSRFDWTGGTGVCQPSSPLAQGCRK